MVSMLFTLISVLYDCIFWYIRKKFWRWNNSLQVVRVRCYTPGKEYDIGAAVFVWVCLCLAYVRCVSIATTKTTPVDQYYRVCLIYCQVCYCIACTVTKLFYHYWLIFDAEWKYKCYSFDYQPTLVGYWWYIITESVPWYLHTKYY